MTLTLTGDFKKLGNWAQKIQSVGGDRALKELSANLAEEALELVAQGFQDQADPAGRDWKQKKIDDGRSILVGRTARLRRGWHRKRASARGFTIGPAVDYAKYHQGGTSRMVARKMVPDGTLPSKWKQALEGIAQAYFRDYFK